MSYDISMTMDTGGSEPTDVEYVGNYTWNCGPMFAEALGCHLGDLHGRLGGDVLEQVDRAVQDMRDNPDKYLPMNPANGWGSYDSATEYLATLAAACRRHPKATIEVT